MSWNKKALIFGLSSILLGCSSPAVQKNDPKLYKSSESHFSVQDSSVRTTPMLYPAMPSSPQISIDGPTPDMFSREPSPLENSVINIFPNSPFPSDSLFVEVSNSTSVKPMNLSDSSPEGIARNLYESIIEDEKYVEERRFGVTKIGFISGAKFVITAMFPSDDFPESLKVSRFDSYSGTISVMYDDGADGVLDKAEMIREKFSDNYVLMGPNADKARDSYSITLSTILLQEITDNLFQANSVFFPFTKKTFNYNLINEGNSISK